jgi:hypothetical protein
MTAARWHTWPSRPDERTVRDHIDRFFRAVHDADLTRAIALCPIYTYRDPLLLGPDDEAGVAGVRENIQDILGGYDYIDIDDEAWPTHVTPPSEVGYAQLGLVVPDDKGDVLANVFVDGEVTDVTAIFALVSAGGAWQLAFKMLKVM